MSSLKFHMVSLGCAKNMVDTENIGGSLCREGHLPTAELNDADVVIINTCAFLKKARRESLQEIGNMVRSVRKMGRKRTKILVAGCLARYLSEKKLNQMIPSVDRTFSPGTYDSIPSYVRDAFSLDLPALKAARPGEHRLLTASPHSVYVKIADGCDNRCSYCLIPFLRGPLCSRPVEDVLAEVEVLLQTGAKEINLVAQDTTAYGLDLYGKKMLGKLLQKLCRMKGPEWIRILYTHPSHLDEELLNIMAGEERVCNYIDMPLQHVSDPVMARMGRKTTKKEIVNLYEKIRKTIPKVALRTTVMVGYPGESDAEFNEMLLFLKEYPFERLGAFEFSAERGTPAYKENQQVSPHLARERYRLVMEQQALISRKYNRELLGKQCTVLVDEVRRAGNRASARLATQAPEVDGKVVVSGAGRLETGKFQEVIIRGIGTYNLLADTVF